MVHRMTASPPGHDHEGLLGLEARQPFMIMAAAWRWEAERQLEAEGIGTPVGSD
jgi:hypothetical protein